MGSLSTHPDFTGHNQVKHLARTGQSRAGVVSVGPYLLRMSKTKPKHACTSCGWTSAKWVGRCGQCKEWGTVQETTIGAASPGTVQAGAVTEPAQPARMLADAPAAHRPTGLGEFDRVLGGGVVPGSVTLLSGEPGIGKSTLVLEVGHAIAKQGLRTLIVTGEESAIQVGLRARRVGADHDLIQIAHERDLAALVAHVEATNPDLLVVDSVQAFASADVDGQIGGVAQVKAVGSAVTSIAKSRGLSTILIGQVTKNNDLAGPKQLEHAVDVVVSFESDQSSPLRLLRATKNRYGSVDEVACFLQGPNGLEEVPDPSGLFLTERDAPVPGSCVTVMMEGRRAIPVEIQSLVSPEKVYGSARRVCDGLESSRLAMILAILDRHAGAKLTEREVYAASSGGIKVREPAADLPLLLAVYSAATRFTIPAHVAALGEVSLTGDIRRVQFLPQRAAEVARVGFTTLLVPPGSRQDVLAATSRYDVAVVEVPTVEAATHAVQAFPAASTAA